MRHHALLAAVLLALPACTSTGNTAAGTSASYNKVTGSLTSNLGASLERTYAAAQAALKDLEFRTFDQSKDALKAILKARMADGDSITITLEKKDEKITAVSIDAGPFGKESTVRLILDKIESRAR